MSRNVNHKKYRKQKYKQKFPWPLVVLGGILMLVAGFLVFANKGESQFAGGTPAINVDQKSIDYGYVPFGENKTFKIKVTNTGDGVLRFKDKPYIEVLEGC